MGMSTRVYGIILPDEKWKKMKSVYDACRAAGINPPLEVEEFLATKPQTRKALSLIWQKASHVLNTVKSRVSAWKSTWLS